MPIGAGNQPAAVGAEGRRLHAISLGVEILADALPRRHGEQGDRAAGPNCQPSAGRVEGTAAGRGQRWEPADFAPLAGGNQSDFTIFGNHGKHVAGIARRKRDWLFDRDFGCYSQRILRAPDE
jgi:hypothetical protein